jgi:Fe2+ or Zn2+ uptake regulation protein
VYPNLDHLVEAGLVQRQRPGRHRSTDAHGHTGQSHDHLGCRECGRVFEFVSPSIQAMLNEICRAHGFSNEARQIQVLGLCRACAAAAAEAAEEKSAAEAASADTATETAAPARAASARG